MPTRRIPKWCCIDAEALRGRHSQSARLGKDQDSHWGELQKSCLLSQEASPHFTLEYIGPHSRAIQDACFMHLHAGRTKEKASTGKPFIFHRLQRVDMGAFFEFDISCGACHAYTHTRAKWISVKSNVEDFKTALILNGLRVAPASNTTNEQGCKRLDPARIQGELFVRVAR